MPQMQIVTRHNGGKPLNLADLAQFVADLTAAGVPATAVPAISMSWEPGDRDLRLHAATAIGCYVSTDELAAMTDPATPQEA